MYTCPLIKHCAPKIGKEILMKTSIFMLLALLLTTFVANHAFAQTNADILKNFLKQNHPEQTLDEFFWVNAFEPLEPEYWLKKMFGCKTLRFGKKAYRDNENNDTILPKNFRPVFIARTDPCVDKLPKPVQEKKSVRNFA